MKKKFIITDGNSAAAYISYFFSEIIPVYPITPTTSMAESCYQWHDKKKLNIFNHLPKIIQMHSEKGVISLMHGALSCGFLTSTFTSSQGLLLMLPTMYKIAGECLPTVIHVATRALSTQALCIFSDHQDVMACQQSGFCILASNNPQEVQDFALIAHLVAIKLSLPFLHFFDGFKTSHEINKVQLISLNDIKKLFPYEEFWNFKKNAHNPFHPKMTGYVQNSDTYFQVREATNKLYNKVYSCVEMYMKKFAKITNRSYQSYEYYGHKQATDLIVIMGSGADCVQEVIDFYYQKKKKYGLVKIRLYRPFFAHEFVNCFPKTVKRICVLDREKELGSHGESLYKDVVLALNQEQKNKIKVIGGRYGLGGKDFTPNDVISIYENLAKKNGLKKFTVGINDDVTNMSLIPSTKFLFPSNYEVKFWGLSGDGMVSTTKSIAKIIGNLTNKYIQACFEYDAKKENGLTISNLRIGKKQINSHYYLQRPNFIGINHFNYVYRYDVLQNLAENSTILLNTIYQPSEIGKYLPNNFKEKISKTKSKLFVIDANKIANYVGLDNYINVIMETCFFKITKFLQFIKAKKDIIASLKKKYSYQDEKIINANLSAINLAINNCKEVSLKKIMEIKTIVNFFPTKVFSLKEKFYHSLSCHQGDKLPVSQFCSNKLTSLTTTKYQKLTIAKNIPIWNPKLCIQCGKCIFTCPHSALRAKIFNNNDLLDKPKNFQTNQAYGMSKDYQYRLQISPQDCTGCGVCTKVCPMKKNNVLKLQPINQFLQNEIKNWDYFNQTKNLNSFPFKKDTIKNLQFQHQYLEFPNACSGCGQTPYLKAITQLFGNKMIIANATGCSSIWSSNSFFNPYTIDRNGLGPSWANSLFENNAEFGLGIALAIKERRENVINNLRSLQTIKSNKFSLSTKKTIDNVLNNLDNDEKINLLVKNMINCLKKEKINRVLLREIINDSDQISKKSIWIVGGDGWAYDINFDGLDQLLSSNENINILVLDNEGYANTGGQTSQATPIGVVTKFSPNGKKENKKDLSFFAMNYPNVFVAQVAMGADYQQFIDTIIEAEAYNGVSLIIAYAPCIIHGIKMSDSQEEQKMAVACGYWQLFKYNPSLKQKIIYQSPPINDKYQKFLKGENRYRQLLKKDGKVAKILFKKSEENVLKVVKKWNIKGINTKNK